MKTKHVQTDTPTVTVRLFVDASVDGPFPKKKKNILNSDFSYRITFR